MPFLPSHLEGINDLNLKQIQDLLKLAKCFKDSAKTKAPFPDHTQLRNSLGQPVFAATFFKENSTRTKLSFEAAIKNLKLGHLHFETQNSSLKKGESLEQTLLTLQALGVEVLIYRTPLENEFRGVSGKISLKLINGGDGKNEHPTQALTDLFTLSEIFPSLENKTMAIIGDCKHSRVCHSLLKLLPQFGLKIILCGPQSLLMDNLSQDNSSSVSQTTSLEEALRDCDIVYLLRIQAERHQTNEQDLGPGKEKSNHEFLSSYIDQFGVNLHHIEKICKKKSSPFHPVVLHPGPANIGVEISENLFSSPYFKGHEQVRHALFLRMALIDLMVKDLSQEVQRENATPPLQPL